MSIFSTSARYDTSNDKQAIEKVEGGIRGQFGLHSTVPLETLCESLGKDLPLGEYYTGKGAVVKVFPGLPPVSILEEALDVTKIAVQTLRMAVQQPVGYEAESLAQKAKIPRQFAEGTAPDVYRPNSDVVKMVAKEILGPRDYYPMASNLSDAPSDINPYRDSIAAFQQNRFSSSVVEIMKSCVETFDQLKTQGIVSADATLTFDETARTLIYKAKNLEGVMVEQRISPEMVSVLWADMIRTPGSCVGPAITDLFATVGIQGQGETPVIELPFRGWMLRNGKNYNDAYTRFQVTESSWLYKLIKNLPQFIAQRYNVEMTFDMKKALEVKYRHVDILVPGDTNTSKATMMAMKAYTYGRPALLVRICAATGAIYCYLSEGKEMHLFSETALANRQGMARVWDAVLPDESEDDARRNLQDVAHVRAVVDAVQKNSEGRATEAEKKLAEEFQKSQAEIIIEIPLKKTNSPASAQGTQVIHAKIEEIALQLFKQIQDLEKTLTSIKESGNWEGKSLEQMNSCVETEIEFIKKLAQIRSELLRLLAEAAQCKASPPPIYVGTSISSQKHWPQMGYSMGGPIGGNYGGLSAGAPQSRGMSGIPPLSGAAELQSIGGASEFYDRLAGFSTQGMHLPAGYGGLSIGAAPAPRPNLVPTPYGGTPTEAQPVSTLQPPEGKQKKQGGAIFARLEPRGGEVKGYDNGMQKLRNYAVDTTVPVCLSTAQVVIVSEGEQLKEVVRDSTMAWLLRHEIGKRTSESVSDQRYSNPPQGVLVPVQSRMPGSAQQPLLGVPVPVPSRMPWGAQHALTPADISGSSFFGLNPSAPPQVVFNVQNHHHYYGAPPLQGVPPYGGMPQGPQFFSPYFGAPPQGDPWHAPQYQM